MQQRQTQRSLLIDDMVGACRCTPIADQPSALARTWTCVSDATMRSTEQRDHRALRQALGIDHYIVVDGTQFPHQPPQDKPTRTGAGCAQYLARQLVDLAHHRTTQKHARPTILTDPSDGVTRMMQVSRQGEGVQDVAEGTQPDDEHTHGAGR